MKIKSYLDLQKPSIQELFQFLCVQYDCRVTLYDHHGILHGVEEGVKELFRFRHDHPACEWKRKTNKRWFQNCRDHCKDFTKAHHEKYNSGMITHCWKGLFEVSVPIRINDQFYLTLFAGPFQWQGISPKKQLGEKVLHLYKQLPVLEENKAKVISSLLYQLGYLLCGEFMQPKRVHGKPKKDQIKNQISLFFKEKAHLQPKLSDLANYLFISPSRTSHLLKEMFNKTFTDLLHEEQMERAKHLLLNSDLSIVEIAQEVGFRNPNYFFSCFKKATGKTPRAFKTN